MIRQIFNENIDNSDDLGDMLVGDDPNDLLNAIKNLDEVARDQFLRLFKQSEITNYVEPWLLN